MLIQVIQDGLIPKILITLLKKIGKIICHGVLKPVKRNTKVAHNVKVVENAKSAFLAP